MFYDYDLLNRRGGKLSIVWLAAHQKLKLQGKGSRSDLRQALAVNVGRTVREILRYVRLQKAPKSPNEPSPRFSLYLSAMLTHGAILVYHTQVKHEVANIKLALERKTVDPKPPPKPPSNNVNCQQVDISWVQIPNEDELFRQPFPTLPETELGGLAAVISELGPSTGIYGDDGTNNLQFMQPEGPLTADAVENDFRELEQAFDMARRDPNGHFTTADRITLRDPDSAPPLIQEIRQQDEEEIVLPIDQDGLEFFGPLPEPIDVDDPVEQNAPEHRDSPGRPSLTRSNSKRGHDGSDLGSTPSKRRTPPAHGSPAPMDAQENTPPPEPIEVDHVPDASPVPDAPPVHGASPVPDAPVPNLDHTQMELPPLNPADMPEPRRRGRGGGRRRRRRLIIDGELNIAADVFRAMTENYADTMRAPNSKADAPPLRPRLRARAIDLLNRPSRNVPPVPLRNLITRHMIVRPRNNSTGPGEGGQQQAPEQGPQQEPQQELQQEPQQGSQQEQQEPQQEQQGPQPEQQGPQQDQQQAQEEQQGGREMVEDVVMAEIDVSAVDDAVVAAMPSPIPRVAENAAGDDEGNIQAAVDGAIEAPGEQGDLPPVEQMDTLPAPFEPLEDTMPDPEFPRPPSQEGSYAGSLLGASTSRVDVSGLDRSRGSPVPAAPPERTQHLETLREVSVETSSMQSSRPTMSSRPDDTTCPSLGGPPPTVPEEDENLAELPAVNPLPADDSAASNPTDLVRRFQGISLSPVLSTPSRDQRVSQNPCQEDLPDIAEMDELLQQIESRAEENGVDELTFRQLVPPENNHRLRAASVFERLLWLKKRHQVDLRQDAPYEDIFIRLLF